MFKRCIYKILFLLIVFIAVILRFWELPNIPVSLSHDEVAIGYNSWSILQTGRDEYGVSYPMLFRSFDEYKLPGYIYFTAVSESIFGLNEFAVRFPSAFFGTLTVIVFYFLMKEIFIKYSKPTSGKILDNRKISIIAVLMLAISPWHINFSRAAFEANGSLFFIVAGIYFLFKSLNKPLYLTISFLLFVISFYFYYTSRLLIPIVLLMFIILYRDRILIFKKYFILASVISIFLLVPVFSQMLTSKGRARVNQVSIFEDKTLTNPYSQAILKNNSSIFARTIYNRRVAYLHQFSDNYLKNFAPDFYFVSGTGPMGLMYLWEIPFFAFGIYLTLKLKAKWKWILLVWYLSVPIVGGLTVGQPNALRTLANVPMTILFTSMGIYGIFRLIKHTRFVKVFSIFFAVTVIFFFARFLSLYFDYNPRFVAGFWGDGHKQMARFVKENKGNYDKIYITGDYWRPYIYMLFYMSYSPEEYQKNGTRNAFDNLIFGQASWDKGNGIDFSTADLPSFVKENTLFLLSGNDYNSQKGLIKNEKRPYNLRIVKEINGVLTDNMFYAVTIQ